MLTVVSHGIFVEHETPFGHPESPDRYGAALSGFAHDDLVGGIHHVEATACSTDALLRVHSESHVKQIEAFDGQFAQIDADTSMSPQSFHAARTAAGAGISAVREMADNKDKVGFVVARPPGHHATRDRSMGFCLFNNIAVTARSLSAAGERVAILDIDAHHGNGTQDIFYDDPDVLFVSWHQFPNYPGTGLLEEIGGPNAEHSTINLPVPPGTCADVVFATFGGAVGERLDAFAPTWILVSFGFDSHREDPLCSLGLDDADYALFTRLVMACSSAPRVLGFLEGGYNLDVLSRCCEAVGREALGETHSSVNFQHGPTTSSTGHEVVTKVNAIHSLSRS